MKRILCIDGGGMRGYIPAAILADLERQTGKPCWKMFDMIYGTSIGGISAALLGAGTPAKEIIPFFTEDGPIIFKKHWWRSFGLICPRYAAAPIERVLKRRLDQIKMTGLRTFVGITSFELKSQEPYFFKNFGGYFVNDYVWQAARATSAAQTYFPAFKIPNPGRDRVFWDGGNVANNPALCAYADAVKQWGDQEPMTFLSLGCGAQTVSMDVKKIINGGALRAAAATVGLLFEAGSEDVDFQMEQLIGDDYIRIQPNLTEPLALDDASDEGISKLNSVAINILTQNSAALKKFISTL